MVRGKARSQPGVGVEEVVHLLGVAGHDHHHLVPAVFDQLDQGVDRLPAEGVLGPLVQGVGLVN